VIGLFCQTKKDSHTSEDTEGERELEEQAHPRSYRVDDETFDQVAGP